MSEPRDLKGARVFVTGGNGFLGRHLIARLKREGAEIFAPPRTEADITNRDQLQAAVDRARPDLVFHLAAYGSRSADRDPALLQTVNIAGTSNLLAAVPATVRFVMAGTCGEYGNVHGPAAETTPCRPVSAYATAKHEAVKLATADAARTERPLVVLRPYGPFGPFDDPDRVLPAAIIGLLEGREVPLTAGTQIRDFSYVDDHVEAFIRAATTPGLAPGAIFNIGTGHGVTIREALTRVEQIVSGSGRLLFGAKPMRPDDIEQMVPDVTAAKRALGFEVVTSFDEGIRRTADAFRQLRMV